MRPFKAASPLVVGLGGSGAASSLLTGLVGYWKLDEASGNRADSSGLGHTLGETAASVNSAAGKVSNGASFVRASSKWLKCASTSNLQMGDIDFSIACWVNFTAIGVKQTILGKANTTNWEYLVFLELDGFADNKIGFYSTHPSGGFVYGLVYWPTVSAATTWYFVVAIHDAVNDVVKLSVNNAAFTTSSFVGGPDISTDDFLIGGQPIAADLMGGVIDEVGIWKKVLSAGEITTLYNAGAGITYPF